MLVPLVLSSLVGLASTSPVHLARCYVSTPITVAGGDFGPTMVGDYALHVRFSDIDSEPISRIAFTLNDGVVVSDIGTFSPGVTINNSLPLEGTEATTCSVTAVTFADGTMWSGN